MAGVITHMVIACEIIKRLPKGTLKEESLFYLGNLAPDAIHAREGYVRDLKKHTHFRDDILDKDFELQENQAKYREKLAKFIEQNKDREGGLFELYLGYVAHILTDELFMITVRKEFCMVMEQQGIAQSDRLFFEYIIDDMNRNDLLLVKHYDAIEEVKEKLSQVKIHPIDNYLSYEEMDICMRWMITRHFVEEHELLEPRYISYQRTISFIREAADYIVSKLSEEGSPFQMIPSAGLL